MNNILILSAGRRVELVTAFREAMANLNICGKVICTDMYPELSSACMVADSYFKVPRATDEAYIDYLMTICQNNSIKLVIPTIDTDLEKLSRAKDSFRNIGCHISIPEPAFVTACRDKRKTAELFQLLDIASPEIYDSSSMVFPCFCKPYNGSSSIGAFVLNNKTDLTDEILNNKNNMYMELIGKEYMEVTVDCYFSKQNELRCLVPRERIETRSGEVSKGVTRKNGVYNYLLERLKVIPGVIGCITVQVFFNKKTGDIKGLEINPRFGGGYPLSYAAGANYPLYLLKEYINDEPIDFIDDWEADLLMLRYDAKVLSHAYPDI
ncbi:ATP-grasp domain-containing protein [Citrobacter freundii]|nr:ATP-grasp domain-containing protein [Citrobacter freundii]ELK6345510.1 ATP-grasp domain-containing protein [Citrobacter freundii]MDN4196101.1 ATP-grasp domain-containing protein [Citrobacter freundii]MDN4226631.1 ATP-grasp domain-containing protein [Citrobacter freundii]HDX4551347.1 ATP-grasp domain-containing protein [Citrobacter freundii]